MYGIAAVTLNVELAVPLAVVTTTDAVVEIALWGRLSPAIVNEVVVLAAFNRV
jgi:hypothetical protein